MTRIGILARSEDRGLGHLTWEVFRHLPDCKALVVDIGELNGGFAAHNERYPDQAVVYWSRGTFIDRPFISWWLGGLDVLYSAETFYDRWIIEECRRLGVATVLHTMPELHHADEAALVDQMWCPTPWRMDEPELAGARLVPVPVALDRFIQRRGPVSVPKVLHVAGHAAYMDRNGTKLVAAASHLVSPPVSVWVSSQDETVALGHTAFRVPTQLDYWRMYDFADILLMPRRFGGLCLPIQEAMAAGMAVVALDTEPHDWYGCADVRAHVVSEFMTGSGAVSVHSAEPQHIADAVLALALGTSGGERLLDARKDRSRAWAAAHSWAALLPDWLAALDSAVIEHSMSRG